MNMMNIQAVNIFDTLSYCHETNMDCGTPSTAFHRTGEICNSRPT